MKQEKIGFISLHSNVHGRNLGSDSDGRVYNIINGKIEEEELWKLEESCENDVSLYIVSVKHRRYLYLSCDGILSTVHSVQSVVPDLATAWTFKPCMPETITGDKMRNVTIGGSLALMSVVAAPFAVLGAVATLGFGAGGVASSSVAAGMMSAEAVASGGMITAGSTVATLQSIGAAGLGVVGTSVSLGAGAVTGASMLGIAATIPSGSPVDVGGTQISRPNERLPFCNWRSWL
mmetsp:Transcript_32392/g.37748  ORF Transcript_32392/g.37748 Transcript_32392/m.37748 type:complete len:234 (+) Transcript_32392:132-833(+)